VPNLIWNTWTGYEDVNFNLVLVVQLGIGCQNIPGNSLPVIADVTHRQSNPIRFGKYVLGRSQKSYYHQGETRNNEQTFHFNPPFLMLIDQKIKCGIVNFAFVSPPFFSQQ
jgi:hypothetical protein